jgi:hypothetical protein
MIDLVELIWVLIAFNIVISIYQRWKLTAFSKAKMNEVPELLVNEVKLQLDDGYKLTSVNNNTVKLIKTKRYWFPWMFIPMFPYAINIIFNTSFLCNVYGVELQLVEGRVKLSTF